MIMTQLPVGPFVYNLTMVCESKGDVEKMWETWEVRVPVDLEKKSLLLPWKRGNLLLGPMLPCAMLRF